MKWDTRKITGLAMVAAVSFVVMLPGFYFMAAAPFLKYETKDVVLSIGGFIYGPIGALAAALVVSFAEMPFSGTGFIGLLMNFISSAAFVGIAALVYRKMRSAKGAAIGLTLGSLAMAAVMLLWNYIITPVYMGVPRPVVAGMLLPVFLPFNLVKAGLNTALTLFIYKPLTTALRSARLLPERDGLIAPIGDATGTDASGTDVKSRLTVNASLLYGAILLLIACMIAIYFLIRP